MNVNWLFGKCRRYQQGLSLLAVNALEHEERERVIRHIQACPACRAKLADLKRLAGTLTRDGKDIPKVTVPPGMRQRWSRAVRNSAAEEQVGASGLAGWLSGRKLAWSGVGAMWALILFFRFSGPDVAKPAETAALPLSLREVLLVLKSEPRERSVQAGTQPGEKSAPVEGLPPNTRGWLSTPKANII